MHSYARAIAVLLFGLIFTSAVASAGAPPLSVGGFVQLSSVRQDRNHFFFTFTAVLSNTGPALTGVTATVSTTASNVAMVSGQQTLEFTPVPAGSLTVPGQVTSTNTFTILVDRTQPFSFSMLNWSFNTPFADPGENQTVPVLSTVTLNGSGSTNPTGIGNLTYSWAFKSVPSGSSAQIMNPDSVMATFVPDIIGTYTVSLTVTNSAQLSNTAIVTISTTDVPPTANAGTNQTVTVGATVNLDGTKSTDVNGQTLTYTWQFVSFPPKSTASISNPNSPTPSFVADQPGTYMVGLVVNDGTLDSSRAIVTISSSNTPPVAVATATPQMVNVNGIVQLDGSKSTDVNSNPLTYSWSLNLTQAPGSKATLSNPTIVNPTFTADVPGIYVAQLMVNDGMSNSQATTVMVTTNAVLAPTAIAGSNQKINVGSTVQLSGSGTDPQNLPLSYQWTLTTVPMGSAATLSNSQIANPTFVADLPGTYAALLVVNNGYQQSNSQSPSATVTITSTSSPPVAVPTTVTTTVGLGVLVNLSGAQSSDPDGLPITYMWSLSAPQNSNAVLSDPTSEFPSFLPDVAGTYVAQLIVSDKFASSTPQTVSISAGQMTIALSPSPLNLTVGAAPLTVSVSPGAGNTAITVNLSGYDPAVVSLSTKTVTIQPNTSSTNVTATPVGSGSTSILASSAGYASVGDSVTVTTPTIGISFQNNALGVGVTHTLGGTITLGAPAPQPDGTTVSLSLGQGTGAVSFNPASVTIPAGSLTGSFSVTGTQTGSAIILASATGYGQGSTTILVVTLGGISISQNLSVGVNQTAALAVTLSSPAPLDGETVNLTIGDGTKVSVNPTTLTFAAGSTTPTVAPQVTGLAIGTSSITANGGGYVSNTGSVNVTASVTFSVPSLAVGVGSQPQSFNVILSSAAPSPGVTVTLSSNSTNATVTSSVLIPTGQTMAQAQVTGASAGLATITATTNNQFVSATGASLAVTVTNSLILPCPTSTSGEVNTPFSAQFSGAGGVTPYTYSVVGTLPGGLSLSSNGLVSGTPMATGSFAIQVKDQNGSTATSCQITISAALAMPCPSTTSGEVGTAVNIQFVPSGGVSPYTYSVVGTLPAGLTLSSSGLISGTPTSPGVFNVQVKDAIGVTQQSCLLTINAALALPCPSTTTGEINTAFNVALAATGGVTPYTYSVVGTLPNGLSLNTASGAISGTPMATGTFSIQVKDATGATATSCTLTINVAVSLPCPTPITGEVGLAFSSQLSATGGVLPYTYTVVGTLPTGLTLSTSGAITGIPTFNGTFSVQVKDAAGATATSCTFTIGTAVTLPCPATTAGDVGTAFNSQVSATGGTGPYTYSVVGTLPSGMSLSSTGAITGTPGAPGTFSIKVTDSIGGTATSCTFTISPALALPCPTPTGGDVGAPFSVQVSPTGGSTPYTYTVFGTLPNGLSLNASNGTVSGTPQATGSFSIQVKDAAGVTLTSCAFTISSALTLPCPSTTTGTAGTAFNSQLSASGGTSPYTYSVVGTLPSGLSLNTTSGLINGTPTQAGTFSVQVKDGAGVTVTSCGFTISGALTLPCPTTTVGEMGVAFSTQLSASGGAGSYTYSVVGTLPNGLSLNSASGLINGTPTAAGSFTVQVKDANLATATSCTITINSGIGLPCPTTVTGEVGIAFSTQLAATNGVGPYTYSVVGQLPNGLTLSSNGAISGMPSSNGSFTIQARDALGATATSCQISIQTAVALPCPGTTSGETGIAFSSQVTATGGLAPYAYSVVGSLPTGLSLNTSNGAITGTPQSAGTFNIQVRDALGGTATSCQFTIIGTISLPCPVPTTGEMNQPFSSQLVASGGMTPYTYSVVGTLPGGLSVSTTGLISGTPSAAGSFSIQVKDANGAIANSCTFTIAAAVTLAAPTALSGEAGIAFNSQVTASNGVGAYSYTVVGTIPAGLTLNSGSGAITGTTSASGSFAVKVTDSLGGTATSSSITIAAAVSLACPANTTGDAGSPFSAQLTTSFGVAPFTYSVVGTLPGGLTISSTGGISGTPGAAGSFAVKVTDSLGGTATSCTFTISNSLSLPCPAVVNGEVGAPFSTQFTATGGAGSYTYSVVGSLPSGLSISSSSGLVSGTPQGAGSFSVQAMDANHVTATSSCSVTIAATVTLTCPATNSGTVGTAFSAAMTPAGGILPYTFSLSNGTLPAGLTISAGAISGTPTAAGNFTYQLTDGDSVTAVNACSFSIANAPLTITTTNPLPNGAPSTFYSTTMQAIGGTLPYTWSLGSGAPSWLSLSPGSGLLSGTSQNAGTLSVPVTVTDSTPGTHQSVTVTFTLNIVNGPLAFTTTTLPAAIQNVSYGQTIGVTGGTPPYSNWMITWVNPTTAPTWFTFDPTGVACNANVPTICGTPPNFGSITFTIGVSDSGYPNKQTASQTYTLTINPASGPATISLTGGTGNTNSFSVGQYLEVPLTVTFSQASNSPVNLVLSSNPPGAITFTETPAPVGSSPPPPSQNYEVTLTPGAGGTPTSVIVYLQAAAASGTYSVTASATGYQNATATVTLAPSAFVLSGPQGIGGAFSTFQGIATDLTVGPARLDSSDLFVEYEEVAYGQSFNVPLTVSPSTLGKVSPASLVFSSGSGLLTGGSGGSIFTASSTGSGGASILMSQPAGFTTPKVGASLGVTVQQSGYLPPTLTVGNNLQVSTSIGFTGPLPARGTVTITSNDATRLQFSSTETGPSVSSLSMTVAAGSTSTQSFWVRAYEQPGDPATESIGYSLSNVSFGSSTGSVTLGPSGLVIATPNGQDANFTMSSTVPSATLTLSTALLNGSGGIVAIQEIAADQTMSIMVQSGSTNIGSISSSPLTIPTITQQTIGGQVVTTETGTASTTFVPVLGATGSSTITATSTGFSPSNAPIQSAYVSAGVTGCSISANNGLIVGKFLEAQAQVFDTCAAPMGGTQITLTSNSTQFLQLAVNPTDPGSNSIVVTIPAGQYSASYWVYALGDGQCIPPSGQQQQPCPTMVTYTASSNGLTATDTVTLAPSAILIAAPNFGPNTDTIGAGPVTVMLYTDVLTTDGNNTPQNSTLQQQTIAGNVGLVLSLSDSANGAFGTLSSNTVTMAPGTASTSVTFTPTHAGTTTLSVAQPANWSINAQNPIGLFAGYDFTKSPVTVTQ